MSLVEIAKVGVGIFVGLFGLIMILGVLLGLDDPDGWSIANLAGLIGLGLLPLAAGFGLVRSARRSAGRRAAEALERSALSLAQQHGGVLTAQTLALGSTLSLKEAEATLKRYFEEGYCTLDVGEGGQTVYHFAHLSTAPDRAASPGS